LLLTMATGCTIHPYPYSSHQPKTVHLSPAPPCYLAVDLLDFSHTNHSSLIQTGARPSEDGGEGSRVRLKLWGCERLRVGFKQ
jgi:hypothetical protein